jgi:squalene-hopene/tetraprenyl-beta-curcumene cyclase
MPPATKESPMKHSLLLFVIICSTLVTIVFGQSNSNQTTVPTLADVEQSRTNGMNFLRNSQADDGSWTTPNAPGITALATTALLKSGLDPDSPTIRRAIKHIQGHIKPDGGIYYSDSNHRNYETCIAIMTLHEANPDGRFDKTIGKAQTFLRKLQWDEGEGLESSDAAYGGAGYGTHQRPDMSNTQFLIDALRTTGVPADDPDIQKALLFVSRAQNLESEFNNTPFAAKVGDGGIIYTPAAGGESKAGTTANGGLRSYGSMTYAGLKSMIYAGVKADDKRVKAAFEWISKYYTVTENPGLRQQGLYYYYHTFAKALTVMTVDVVTDADGNQHNWRDELAAQLIKLQRKNGSWVNKADRWYEGDPNMSTAYSLLALSYCSADKDAATGK